MNDATLRLVVATIFGIMLVAAGLVGRPGSILGALIDPAHMDITSSDGSVGGY